MALLHSPLPQSAIRRSGRYRAARGRSDRVATLTGVKIGLNLGYWGAGNDADNLELAREADRLGYAVVWAAEAYGSDAATVLAWVAAQTERIDVGSAIFQIPGRSPALTAMTAATLDTLSGGRFRLGIGVSGPQVSEGWHGVRFDAPLGRTREHIPIYLAAVGPKNLELAGEKADGWLAIFFSPEHSGDSLASQPSAFSPA